MLCVGTRASARLNAVLVAVKLVALAVFVALTIPVTKAGNFLPFAPVA